jgi:LysM repeat protein
VSYRQYHQGWIYKSRYSIILFEYQYTRQYILLTKRAQRQARVYNPTPKTAKSKRNVSVGSFYFIKKGETLYQLSNRYGVSLSDLLLWNPALVVDEITLGALIRISAP